MMNNQQKENKKPSTPTNENGQVLVQAHIKIFDPKTKEVLVNKRA